ncbi:MAG: class I adenylate-forming enzyme family protein [Bdellovibrionota bacterium]
MLIGQQLSTIASQQGAKPALRYLGKDLSYADLKISIARLSYLYSNEIGASPRVALLARNSIAWVQTFFAVSNNRGTCIPLDAEADDEELIAWIKDTHATHVAVTSDLVGRARDLLHAGYLSLPIIEIEKKHGGEYDTSFTAAPDNQPGESDTILVLKTAGTTGKPKYVNFTHKQIQFAAVATRGLLHMAPGETVFSAMAWSHPFSFFYSLISPLLTGGTVVIEHGLKGKELLKFILDNKVKRIVGSRPFFHDLLVLCKNEKFLLPGVKSVVVGLGLVGLDLRRTFGLLKILVCQVYGQSENLWTIGIEDTQIETDDETKIGWCRGIPGIKYRVMDSNLDEISGRHLRTGLLTLSGPTVMQGYLGKDREKETKSALRGSWLHTGDIVSLDGEGETLTLNYIGRKEDLIEINGTLTFPVIVDTMLKGLPGILDAVAFNVKSSHGKQILIAVVVKAPGCKLTESQIIESATTAVPPDLLPKLVAFTDAIPRDLGGNINYSKLRAQFSGSVG